jgi:hypothetical protein
MGGSIQPNPTTHHPTDIYIMASTSCPEVVTYNLNGKMVYVPPAQSHEVSYADRILGLDLVLMNESHDSKRLTSH